MEDREIEWETDLEVGLTLVWIPPKTGQKEAGSVREMFGKATSLVIIVGCFLFLYNLPLPFCSDERLTLQNISFSEFATVVNFNQPATSI